MAGKKDYESRAEELLQPIAEAHQVSIYDVEYVKEGKEWYLRAYIDKPGGVNINDCENVSREFSTALDQQSGAWKTAKKRQAFTEQYRRRSYCQAV